uniref:Uncharacterized protein n=1 Tax=Oryza nivara TaxID=4536 RepID=A0A0E0FLB1_ORYNI
MLSYFPVSGHNLWHAAEQIVGQRRRRRQAAHSLGLDLDLGLKISNCVFQYICKSQIRRPDAAAFILLPPYPPSPSARIPPPPADGFSTAPAPDRRGGSTWPREEQQPVTPPPPVRRTAACRGLPLLHHVRASGQAVLHVLRFAGDGGQAGLFVDITNVINAKLTKKRAAVIQSEINVPKDRENCQQINKNSTSKIQRASTIGFAF